MVVTLDEDGRREAGEGDGSIELRERVAHSLPEPVARKDVSDGGEQNDEDSQGDTDATAACLGLGLFRGKRLVRDYAGVGEVGKTHGLIASVNGAGGDAFEMTTKPIWI